MTFARKSMLALTFLFASASAIADHDPYKMLVNGQEAPSTVQGVAGDLVHFQVVGTGHDLGYGYPPCNYSYFSYLFEGQTTYTRVEGTSLTLTSRPGSLGVGWSRVQRETLSDGSVRENNCDLGGGTGSTFYGWSKPTLSSISIDPPNVKINEPVTVTTTHVPCPADPKNPETSSDPCRGSDGLFIDPGDGRCPAADPFCGFLGSPYTKLGTYTLRAKTRNPAGESNILTLNVDVDPTRAPQANYWVYTSNPKAGTAVGFRNQTQYGFRSLFWDFGDGATSTEENPTHVFAASDDYLVKLIATNEFGTSVYESTVYIYPASGGSPPAAADFTWTPEKPVIGQSVSFIDKSTGSIARWRWNFDDGTDPQYTQNPSHVFTNWGTKKVELWVSNAYGRKGIVLYVNVLSNTGPPVADFDWSPTNVRVGTEVTFTDASAGATSWHWDFGENGATSSLQNPRYTYATPGQKAVTLRVSNAYGTDTITKYFPCHPGEDDKLEARFTWTPSSPNAGEPVSFLDLSTGSPERWSWVITDGTQSNERNLTHTFTAAGEYGVSLRVDKGSLTHILVQVVRVGGGTGPVPDFTWTPGTPAANEVVRFTNLSLNATSYTWDFGDGNTSTAVDPQHQFAEEKTYRVTLTARNAAGQSASITKEIVVSTAPILPVANFTARPNPAAAGETVRFTDTSTGNPTSWQWDFGYGGNTSREQHPTHAFPFEGTFGVTLTVSNSVGRSQPIRLPVTIKNVLQKPDPAFDWSPDPVVASEPVTFQDKSSNSPKTRSWTFGDGNSGSGAAVTHTYAAAGNYSVTLRVSNEAGDAELTRTVTVIPPALQADFIFAPDAPVVGKPVTFTDRSKGTVKTWAWRIDGHIVAATQNVTWTFFAAGEHIVELTVRGDGGSESFRQRALVVAGPPTASFKTSGALVWGGAVTFTDTSSGNPTSRRWYFDKVYAGDGPSVTRTFRYRGYVTVRLEVENEAGKDGLSRYFEIRENTMDGPRIKNVTAQYGPCFFSQFPMTDPVEVEVDWRKSEPGSVYMDINGIRASSSPSTGPITQLTVDSLRLLYDENKDVTINKLNFTAEARSGSPSEAKLVHFLGIRVPQFLDVAPVRRSLDEPKRRSFIRGIYLPPKAYEGGTLTLPKFLGGGEFKIKKTQFKFEKNFRTDCSTSTYLEITGGLELSGDPEKKTSVFAGIKGTSSADDKYTEFSGSLSEELTLGLEAFAGFEKKQKLLAAIPVMTVPCEFPLISDICGAAEVKLEVQGSLGGTVTLYVGDSTTGELVEKGGEKVGKLQFAVTGSLGVGSAKFEAFGGGKAAVKMGKWSDPNFIKKTELSGEIGGRIVWFGTVSEYKYAAGCTLEPGKSPKCGDTVSNSRLETTSANPLALRAVAPLSRNAPVEAASVPPVLLENVSPLADPASAARGEEAIVVFLTEQAAAGAALQRLDVKAMRRNGSTWEAPQTIAVDANGDFNPAAVIDANGRAVVAWERIKNPAVSYDTVSTLQDMPKLLREVEIAVSTSDRGASVWSSPAMLSSNELYDRQPALAALADGRTILAWVREPAGSTSDQQVVARVLSGATWSDEQVVASGLRGVTELALAAKGNEAQLIISASREGTGTDLSAFTFNASAWSVRRDVTNDLDDDRAPMVVYDGEQPRVYWVRGGALVTRTLPDAAIETVRAQGDAAGISNPVSTTRSDGALAIVWPTGSDVRAVVRDPKTKRWSSDVILTDRTRSHSALSAFFTADGRLHVSTLGTMIELRDVTQTIDGQPVLIEGVAFPGRSDLMSFETALRVDLAARGETFVVEPRQPGNGERLDVSIDLQNAAELPVRDVVVDLRRGASVVATTTIAGEWMPGETKQATFSFVHDSTQPELLAVIDPAGATSDAVPENNSARYSFGNRTPLACFQSSAGSGPNPLSVTLDASCSTDLDGSIVRYAWSFGDGQSASGQKIVHTFATAGSHVVLLNVTDGMGSTSSRSITIDVASPVNHRSPAAPHRLYVSIVGRARGLNDAYFVSDLALLNTDLGESVTIDAVYMPDGRSDTYRRQITLQPGQLLQTSDVLPHLFGATDSVGSVRLDLSHRHVVGVARTYNNQPSGTAGFSNDGVPFSAALQDGETGVVLQHWLPGYRTNIGLTEIGGADTEVAVTAYDEQGTAIGSETFVVAAYGRTPVNGHPLFQKRGRIEFTVRGGAAIAYVSTVDNQTGDPIYQSAERKPVASESSTLLVPVVARLAGANNTTWRSDVRVFNASPSSQKLTLELHTAAGIHSATADLAAGQVASFDDVITRVFPQASGNVGGALRISSTGPLLATSRTFNIAQNGTYGIYVPARKGSELLTAGETAYLVGLRENAGYRTNFGMTSFEGNGAVRVRAFDASGNTIGTKEFSVPAGQNMQVGRIFANMGITEPLDAAGLEVFVTEGRLLVYASVNDNRTGDATYVEAAR